MEGSVMYMPKSAQEYMPKSATPVQEKQGGVSGVLRSLGLGILPDAGAAAINIPNFVQHGIPGMMGHKKALDTYKQNYRKNPLANQGLLDKAENRDLAGVGGHLGQDAVGAASWMVPATKVIKGAGWASKAGNLGIQGSAQGGMQAMSQEEASPGSVGIGALTGGLANPAFAGAGNVVTKQLPKYFGIRAYGKAGAQLPEVLNAQRKFGTEDLKGVKNYILESSRKTITKDDLVKPILNLADQEEWVGTPGLSEKAMTGSHTTGRRLVETGALKKIQEQLREATDAFDFYSRLKNMAYAKGISAADNRLASFMRSAAHHVREQIINSTENPEATRHAMDMYAAQTAINAAKNEKNTNAIVRVMERIIPFGEGGLGAIGIIATIPAFSHVAPILLADALLSNKIVAPKIASGLVNMGQAAEKTGISNVLRRLGAGAIVAGSSPQQEEQN